MNAVVSARHMEVTEAIRQYVEQKVAKLPRFYDRAQKVEVVLDKEADKAFVEIVIRAHKHTFVATEKNDDLYAAIDTCLDKVAMQLRRFKDKVRDRQGTPHGERPAQEAP